MRRQALEADKLKYHDLELQNADAKNGELLHNNEEFLFSADTECIRLYTDWEIRNVGITCELHLVVFCIDDRGKFIEKLTIDNQKKSKDGSITLISEVSDAGLQRGRYCVCVKIDMSRVNPDTIAVLVYLDGGPRNFMHLNSCGLRCRDAPGDRGEGTFLSGAGSTTMTPLFRIGSTRTRRDYQGIALCTVYKDGWKDLGRCGGLTPL
jgi:hypothetical protein